MMRVKMMRVKISGVIVANDDKWIYDLMGMESACPGEVQKAADQARGSGETLEVMVNSTGGDLFAGSEIYSILQAFQGRKLITVTGLAASAASMILCAGESEIARTGMVMIHNVSSYASGDYGAMERQAEALKACNRAIAAAYTAKTGKAEEELLKLMDQETWLTASQAVEYGFVDRIANEGMGQGLHIAASTGMIPAETIQRFKAQRQKERAQEAVNLLRLKESKA